MHVENVAGRADEEKACILSGVAHMTPFETDLRQLKVTSVSVCTLFYAHLSVLRELICTEEGWIPRDNLSKTLKFSTESTTAQLTAGHSVILTSAHRGKQCAKRSTTEEWRWIRNARQRYRRLQKGEIISTGSKVLPATSSEDTGEKELLGTARCLRR